MFVQVAGLYPWPFDGAWAPQTTALVIVDMQRDFLEPAGWLGRIGADTAPLLAIVPAVAALVALARAAGIFIVYTVEAHRPDLSDLAAPKRWRAERLGHPIGAQGPLGRHLVQGEAGAAIVPELAPPAGTPVVAKPGKSAFIGTDFDPILRRRGIRNLILAGVTTDGAVQCTLRDANDRGYECLLVEDATASDTPSHHDDQIHTLALAGGHYGSIARLADLRAALAIPVAA